MGGCFVERVNGECLRQSHFAAENRFKISFEVKRTKQVHTTSEHRQKSFEVLGKTTRASGLSVCISSHAERNLGLRFAFFFFTKAFRYKNTKPSSEFLNANAKNTVEPHDFAIFEKNSQVGSCWNPKFPNDG